MLVLRMMMTRILLHAAAAAAPCTNRPLAMTRHSGVPRPARALVDRVAFVAREQCSLDHHVDVAVPGTDQVGKLENKTFRIRKK